MEGPDSSSDNERIESVDRHRHEENGTYSYHHNKAYEHGNVILFFPPQHLHGKASWNLRKQSWDPNHKQF